jgi:hypothetical protein
MFIRLLALVLLSTPCWAELPTGSRDIALTSANERVVIGTANFSGQGTARAISVVLNAELFKDHFLSMRPFKCLEGAKYYCHLPYPYAWKGSVTETDLTDLEYALLFVQKEPNAYGINLWHGIYYKLQISVDGRISGILHEVDMDVLASPPPAGEMRPLSQDVLSKADPNGQWLPGLTIE